MTSVSLVPGPRTHYAPIALSGSKSYTNRALIVGALSGGGSRVLHASQSEGTRLLLSALWQMGYAPTSLDALEGYEFPGLRETQDVQTHTLECGGDGTTIRFLLALAAVTPGRWTLTGDATTPAGRHLSPLVQALTQLGADITYNAEQGSLPLTVTGGNIAGGLCYLDGHESSQFLSALLMVAPLLKNGLEVRLSGPYMDDTYARITQHIMQAFGVNIDRPTPSIYRIPPQVQYLHATYTCELDLTTMGYLCGYALLTGQDVTFDTVPNTTLQSALWFPFLLEDISDSQVERDTLNHTLTFRPGPLHSSLGEYDVSNMLDLVPMLVVIAAFSPGQTALLSTSFLESPHHPLMTHLGQWLDTIGVRWYWKDGAFVIHGQTTGHNKGGTIHCHNDARLAMAAAALSYRLGLRVQDGLCVSSLSPSFWHTLTHLGTDIVEGPAD